MNNLDTLIAEGRLIRHAWTGTDAHGRETACLLAALSPEAGRAESASACPASVMPAWLAYLTPFLADNGSAEAWPGMVRRYADLSNRWHALTEDQWQRLDWTCRRIAVAEADAAAPGIAVVRAVLEMLDRAIAGDVPSDTEWAEAETAARTAAAAARTAAARTAALAAAAVEAAWVAAAATEDAWAAASAMAWAAWVAAVRTAVDRMSAAVLGAIEAEIAGAVPQTGV